MVPLTAGYAGVALLVGGESAGLPIPGETALVAAAVLASQGRLSLSGVIVAAAVGAIVGDNVGYAIGGRGAQWLGGGSKRRQRLLSEGRRFFARHGAKAVFFGRWLPWLRVSVAWLAGAGQMRWPRFLVANALGGLTWAASVGLVTYVVGKRASAVITGAGVGAIALLAVAALAVWLARRRHADRDARPRPGR